MSEVYRDRLITNRGTYTHVPYRRTKPPEEQPRTTVLRKTGEVDVETEERTTEDFPQPGTPVTTKEKAQRWIKRYITSDSLLPLAGGMLIVVGAIWLVNGFILPTYQHYLYGKSGADTTTVHTGDKTYNVVGMVVDNSIIAIVGDGEGEVKLQVSPMKVKLGTLIQMNNEDVDNDGDVDIVFHLSGSSTSTVLLNTGKGFTFDNK